MDDGDGADPAFLYTYAGRSETDASQVSAGFANSKKEKHCSLEGCKLEGRVFKSPERQHRHYAHKDVEEVYDREKHLRKCKQPDCRRCGKLSKYPGF